MASWVPLPVRVRSPTDRGLGLGRPLAGMVILWMPLGGFVSEAPGGEGAVVAEVAMDPDFRLEDFSLFPALEMPFRTCTAFSSAWVRSSSSLRSWGLGLHAAKAKTCGGLSPLSPRGVPHHCKPEDKLEAAPVGGWLSLPGNAASSLVSSPGVGSGAGVLACSLRRHRAAVAPKEIEPRPQRPHRAA